MPTQQFQPPKKRLYYTPAADITVLTAALLCNPWRGKTGWSDFATHMRTNPGFTDSETKGLRDRISLLLSKFRREDMANLRKSGTEEEYMKRERLLQELSDMEEEWAPRRTERPTRRVALDTAEAAQNKVARSLSPLASLLPTYTVKQEDDAGDNALTPEMQAEAEESATTEHSASSGVAASQMYPSLNEKTAAAEEDRRLRGKELELRHTELQLQKEEQQHRHKMESQRMTIEMEERRMQMEDSRRLKENFFSLAKQQMVLMETLLKHITEDKEK